MEGVNPQVPRFRLLRSRAFWFGVPGLVFLLWAWSISRTHYSGALIGGKLLVYQLDQTLRISSLPEGSNAGSQAFHRRCSPEEIQWLKAFYDKSPKRAAMVPHGAAIVIYLGLWAMLVTWRSRQHRALAA